MRSNAFSKSHQSILLRKRNSGSWMFRWDVAGFHRRVSFRNNVFALAVRRLCSIFGYTRKQPLSQLKLIIKKKLASVRKTHYVILLCYITHTFRETIKFRVIQEKKRVRVICFTLKKVKLVQWSTCDRKTTRFDLIWDIERRKKRNDCHCISGPRKGPREEQGIEYIIYDDQLRWSRLGRRMRRLIELKCLHVRDSFMKSLASQGPQSDRNPSINIGWIPRFMGVEERHASITLSEKSCERKNLPFIINIASLSFSFISSFLFPATNDESSKNVWKELPIKSAWWYCM